MARDRRLTGYQARLAGRRGEVLAALWLMAKGYRILGFRLQTPQGEIDLLAQKGHVLAVVEVKLRVSREAALAAVGQRQRERLRRGRGVRRSARGTDGRGDPPRLVGPRPGALALSYSGRVVWGLIGPNE